MKVCLITYYAVTNIGDKILTDVVSWMLRNHGHQVSIVDINARYPYKYRGILGWFEKIYCNCFIHRKSYANRQKYFEKKIKKTDYILFGGGQILQPSHCIVNENINIITKIAEKQNIPISYNAIGFFKAKSSDLCDELRMSLSSPQIRYFTCRESINKFVDFNVFNANVIFRQVCDTAVWSCEAYEIKHRDIKTIKTIGINVIYAEAFNLSFESTPTNEIVNAYVRIYNVITSLGYDCYFFTNGVKKDDDTLHTIISLLSLNKKNIKTATVQNDGKSFLNLLNEFDFIISSRLHTSICAYSLKIPTISLSWDSKIQDFYSQIGFSENVLKISSKYDKEFFFQLIKKSITMYKDDFHYKTYKESIINSIPNFI